MSHDFEGGFGISAVSEENGMVGFSGYFKVDPTTICQFTGLKDSKGVDIFEGDILAFSNKYEKVRYAIEWLDYSYILVRQDKTKTIMIQKSRIEKELYVIGNKFDRKEGEK